MTSLTEQPKNMNPLADVQFKFEISAIPNTSFFLQGCNLPGITMQVQEIGVPRQTGFARMTGVVEYEELSITFLVDEYLKNWQEIYEWIVGNPSYTSAVLTILSSSMNPTMEIHFQEVFPIGLASLEFDSTTADPVYHQTTVSFKYSKYTIKNLLNN